MAPKTARFEMRLDAALADRIDQWCEANGTPSRAEAARTLMLHGLEKSSPDGVHISDAQKLIIAMIADLSKPENRREIDPSEVMDVIYGGHYWALKWEMTGLFHDHVDEPGQVSFVVDTLDMWTFIEEAVERFTPAQRKRLAKEVGPLGENPEFRGFDGNNEATYMGIAGHIVEKMNRFQRFKGRGVNSHFPSVARNARMIKLFQPMRVAIGMRQPIGLSVDEVISLLKRET